MKIRNFTFKELVDTQTGIDNIPKSFYYVANIMKLAYYLQTIRDNFGKPIIVNSGFRTPEVNQAVGGVPTSNHLYGIAADITCARSFFPELCEILQAEKEEGLLKELIIYPTKQFIHLAIHPCDYGK